jgi:aminotransferase
VHTDESVAHEILKVHDALVTCAPVISQYAAMGALEMGEADVQKMNRAYKKRRDVICAHLDDLSHIFSYVRPESSYYVFPKILCDVPHDDPKYHDSVSWRFALWMLEQTKVVVVPGVAFGPNGERHVRFSFGRSTCDIDTAFMRIKKYFGKK